MNVVLIISDTLRADHLGCYGSTFVHTPNLDKLADQSVVFEDHHAASFPTMPARADFFLGKVTFTYRGWEPLPPTETSLASILQDHGYTTAGVVDTPFYVANGMAYDRGFRYFYDSDAQRRGLQAMPFHPQLFVSDRLTEFEYAAPLTFHTAEMYLEKLIEGDFFLLVDTWDPHEPWDPPHWYVKPYLEDYDGQTVDPPYDYWEEAGLTPKDLAIAHACYAGEITMVDRWVGRLLERIDSLGVANDTAIVFTSDHGFYFGEHGILGKMLLHSYGLPDQYGRWSKSSLYREVTHTPLLIRTPGVNPKRIGALTSAIDVMPTILEITGTAIPDGVQGRSLMPLINGEVEKHRDVVFTSPPLTNPDEPIRVVDDVTRYIDDYLQATVTTKDWTYIYSAWGKDDELYDSKVDPAQEYNVVEEHPSIAAELRERYFKMLIDIDTPERYLLPRLEPGDVRTQR